MCYVGKTKMIEMATFKSVICRSTSSGHSLQVLLGGICVELLLDIWLFLPPYGSQRLQRERKQLLS